MKQLEKNDRIAVVVSILWMIVATIIALADSYRASDLEPLVYAFRVDTSFKRFFYLAQFR